ALLALELPAVLNAISGRHRDRLHDGRPNVVDDTAEIAAGDVGGNHDPPLHVLAQDHVRAFFAPDLGEKTDGYWSAARRVNRQVGDALEVHAAAWIELHDEIEGRTSVENATDRCTREA